MPDLRPEGCKRICKDGRGRSKGGIKKSLRDELARQNLRTFQEGQEMQGGSEDYHQQRM